MAQIYVKAFYEIFPCLVSLTITNLFEEGDRDSHEFCGEMTKMKSSGSTTEKINNHEHRYYQKKEFRR